MSNVELAAAMTMGSLFDGIGGFPLGAARYGIKTIWASEIEPFPMEVTKRRFPSMVHKGDITKLSGKLLFPVDIICGGSPCQDLSVAGARAGLSGARSGLFMEQIRIIKEMRTAERERGRTGVQIRPRYMAWENVPVLSAADHPKVRISASYWRRSCGSMTEARRSPGHFLIHGMTRERSGWRAPSHWLGAVWTLNSGASHSGVSAFI